MAHLLIDNPIQEKKASFVSRIKSVTRTKLAGKFGLSFNLGRKEVFIGVALADIEVEQVVRKRRPKPLNKKARAWTLPIN